MCCISVLPYNYNGIGNVKLGVYTNMAQNGISLAAF
jgi:hypothetical protein